jgi:hypothetical protein
MRRRWWSVGRPWRCFGAEAATRRRSPSRRARRHARIAWVHRLRAFARPDRFAESFSFADRFKRFRFDSMVRSPDGDTHVAAGRSTWRSAPIPQFIRSEPDAACKIERFREPTGAHPSAEPSVRAQIGGELRKKREVSLSGAGGSAKREVSLSGGPRVPRTEKSRSREVGGSSNEKSRSRKVRTSRIERISFSEGLDPPPSERISFWEGPGLRK